MTPLLMHWSYILLVLTYQLDLQPKVTCACRAYKALDKTKWSSETKCVPMQVQLDKLERPFWEYPPQ